MALVYLTVELAEHDNDLGAAYDAARAKGWPVVQGELAEDDGYHYYPERAAVRAWLEEARLGVVEQSDGEGYWHLLCRAGPLEDGSGPVDARAGDEADDPGPPPDKGTLG
jgi:hypothetical protein